jgi:hypothetical protein
VTRAALHKKLARDIIARYFEARGWEGAELDEADQGLRDDIAGALEKAFRRGRAR